MPGLRPRRPAGLALYAALAAALTLAAVLPRAAAAQARAAAPVGLRYRSGAPVAAARTPGPASVVRAAAPCSRARHIRRGAVIGAAAGAVALGGLVAAFVLGSHDGHGPRWDRDATNGVLAGTAVGALAGGFVGAAVGAAVPRCPRAPA